MNQDIITCIVVFSAIVCALFYFAKQLSAFTVKKQKPGPCAGCSGCAIRELKH